MPLPVTTLSPSRPRPEGASTPADAAPPPSLNSQVLPEIPRPLPPPPRLRGAAFALRAGGLAFPVDFAAIAAYPVALEAAWDSDMTWSVFAELSYYQVTVAPKPTSPEGTANPTPGSAATVRAIPLTLGFTTLAALGEHVGLRFRLGAVGAVVSSLSSSPGAPAAGTQYTLAPGALAGVAFALLLGPGRLCVEARYSWVRADLGLRPDPTDPPFNPAVGDVGGAQVLAGYRLEL